MSGMIEVVLGAKDGLVVSACVRQFADAEWMADLIADGQEIRTATIRKGSEILGLPLDEVCGPAPSPEGSDE